MYINDRFNNCKIFDKYLLDDLSQYSLSENQQGLSISYGGGVANPVLFRLDHLDTIIDNSPLNNLDIWTPAFVSNLEADAFIDNDILSRNGILTDNRIGIENFMSFKPQFQNWTPDNDTLLMKTDWFVDGPLIPFISEHALMFWFRLNSPKIYKFEEIPNGTKINCLTSFTYKNLTIDSNTFLIKKNSNFLIRLDKSETLVTNGVISGSSDREILITDIENLKDLEFKIFKESALSNVEDRDVDLWIANGENFWYYNTPSDKKNNRNRSLSYISPCLHSVYRQIYHYFTISLKKDFTSLNNQQIRFLKKISFLPISDFFKILSIVSSSDFHSFLSKRTER